ncbi:MAG: Txe/YoeB family addiction module toxin [Defluviitaleaceae bacterium]|nr:Txe/YoeB family addiction module toxin [Defluviitaleaceae bacterium]
MEYKLTFSKQAEKDARLLESANLDDKAKTLLSIIKRNPYEPPCEKLIRELKGCYSRRINKQHRLVYEILPNDDKQTDKEGNLYKGIIYIMRMWTHYE